MTSLAGRVVLVTGAGAGVGRGLALALGAAGATVVVSARRSSSADEVAAEISARGGIATAVACDVTVSADAAGAVAAAIENHGRLDHVVHNAASRRSSEVMALADVDEDTWREQSAVALGGLQRLARLAFAHLSAAGGSLLVLTSPAGIEGSSTLPVYATVKGGQRGFVKALAREWGRAGVRVNALAPLAVSPALEKAFAESPDLAARLADNTPLGRIGDAEQDIGPVAVFLCSDAAAYVTGQTLVVSGGRFTGL